MYQAKLAEVYPNAGAGAAVEVQEGGVIAVAGAAPDADAVVAADQENANVAADQDNANENEEGGPLNQEDHAPRADVTISSGYSYTSEDSEDGDAYPASPSDSESFDIFYLTPSSSPSGSACGSGQPALYVFCAFCIRFHRLKLDKHMYKHCFALAFLFPQRSSTSAGLQ